MAPKGKKDKKKGKDAEPAEKQGVCFTEVERTFMELQIAECNRIIARLRTTVDGYEQKHEEMQRAYEKLDEDRADIIAYLKKNLNLKTEENAELKEKVRGLEETREIENAEFKATVNELEKNFRIMKDQLTSENKLLAGKLNTLEEFRAIRDDLMKKFEKQEQDFKDQELKYKRIIYDAEKKFVIGKDKLKKEMEARLLQLAQDFQDATELRIAASTHRVIRENIAINNELDNLLSTQAKVSEQNEKYKESERAARVAMESAEEERDKAINKSVVQLKVIDQLTAAFQEMKKERALMDKRVYDFDKMQAKLQKLTKENSDLSMQVRILEQNLHARMTDQTRTSMQANKAETESIKLKKILKQAAIAVQAGIKLGEWATVDPKREIEDRQILLSRLLEIITQYREIQRAESVDTLASFGKIYEEGDLGFVPKPTAKKSVVSAALYKPSQDKVSVSHISESPSPSASSLASLKTLPSTQIIPQSSKPVLAVQDSLVSFATSSKSTVSESSGSEPESIEELTDIEKMLQASKLEMQKSILKDLAYSQIQLQSQQKFTEEQERAKQRAKSVVFEEDDEEIDEQREKRVTIVQDESSDKAKGEEVGVKEEKIAKDEQEGLEPEDEKEGKAEPEAEIEKKASEGETKDGD